MELTDLKLTLYISDHGLKYQMFGYTEGIQLPFEIQSGSSEIGGGSDGVESH